jgi:hypothetical protein
VAVLAVNRIIISGAVFSCGKNSKITDNAYAARHLTYLFFGPLQGPFLITVNHSTPLLLQSRCPKNEDGHEVLQG